jgi:phage regulator Rha-like protein
MLDYDLAALYEVETKNLNKAVKRNLLRFPKDFMFQVTSDELESLRFQIGTSKRSGRRYMPYAFTKQGVAMLSTVLNSEKAISVSIAIIRAFVMLRQYVLDYKELKEQIEKLEKEMNHKFKDVYEALNYLISPPVPKRKPIGYKRKKK